MCLPRYPSIASHQTSRHWYALMTWLHLFSTRQFLDSTSIALSIRICEPLFEQRRPRVPLRGVAFSCSSAGHIIQNSIHT
ncbi:hypothetical protein HBH96_141490 [Parastagonospora nodorum]|nr:hypothetical protein HBH96_141490 [Parastagonospora nodorum]